MVLKVSRFPKILKIGIWAPYTIHRDNRISKAGSKKGFFILWYALVCISYFPKDFLRAESQSVRGPQSQSVIERSELWWAGFYEYGA